MSKTDKLLESFINTPFPYMEKREKKLQDTNWEKIHSKMEDIFKIKDTESFRKFSRIIQQEDNFMLKTAKLANIAFGAYM